MTTVLLAIALTIFSPSFEDGGLLPVQFSGYGEDISPELVLENLADEAKYLAVSFCDEDMPFTDEYCHWVCWNIPATDRIPENIPAGAEIYEPFHAVQGVGYGRHKYRGHIPRNAASNVSYSPLVAPVAEPLASFVNDPAVLCGTWLSSPFTTPCPHLCVGLVQIFVGKSDCSTQL